MEVNPGTLLTHHASLSTNPPPLTMSLGCMMFTCHTLAFVPFLLSLSCLVLLHHTPQSFLVQVHSEVGSARRDNTEIWQVLQCYFSNNSAPCVTLSAATLNISIFDSMSEMIQLLHHIVQYLHRPSNMNACTLWTTHEHNKGRLWHWKVTFLIRQNWLAALGVRK